MPETNGFEYEIVESMFDDDLGKSCILKNYDGPVGKILEIPSYIKGIPVRYIDSDFWIYVRVENEIRLPETLITPSCSDSEKYVEIDFDYIENVRVISVNKDNRWLFSEEGVLYIRGQENSKLNSILYRYPTGKPGKEFSVAEGCTAIFRHAFENVCGIKDINLRSVKEIGESAFEDCKNLKHIKLNNVELIKKYAFSNCESINEVYLSSKTKAESKAFWYCTGIKAFHLESIDIDIPSNYLGRATKLKKIDLYGQALSRFAYIDGILYSFSKEGICPVFCPSSYPQKEITIPDFVDYFESEVFCGSPDEDRVIYYSKNTEFLSNTCTCDEFRLIEITHQDSRSIIENCGYLLYVQGPEQVNLDLSDIHDFGEIAFRDLKRIRHLTAGNLLSDEKISYLQSIVQIDNIDDRPWLLADTSSVFRHAVLKDEMSHDIPAEKVIVPANHIIIVTSSFNCRHERHDIRSIEIQVRILSKGLVTVIPLKGFLCNTCKQCYVDPHVFARFINAFEPQTDNHNGIINPTDFHHTKTRIIQNTFLTARGRYGEVYSSEYSDSEPDGLRVQSFPKWCGYSTYSIPFFEDGKLRNRLGIDLLKSIINSRLMSKSDVIKFLTSLINLNRNKIKYQDSVYVWEGDLEDIKQFAPNESMKGVRYLLLLDKIFQR